jgi:hypothetical protein
MRTTEDYHLKLDKNTAAELNRYLSLYGGTRNRFINNAIRTHLQLLKLHRIFLQYQELGCDIEQFRADYCKYDFGDITWLLQED